MAKHTHGNNIPPGQLGRLEEGFPRSNDNNVTIRPLLDENEMKERKAVGLRR